jgi:translation initiation factor 4G
MFYDGPVAPLVKSANHWKPKKSDNALIIAEKQVKSILNKMTKEKFDRLAGQMLNIRIESLAILTMMINNVFDKAIDEPSFGDMYADLCVRLSKSAQIADFVHLIESDEEPPTEDGAPSTGESSSYSVYRWSNNVTTSDSDVVGPFSSADECYDAALSEEDEFPPGPRGETELELVSISIKRGIFVKILKKKQPAPGEGKIFYVVYFPVTEASECGQQLSEIFLSEVECRSDATKKNSFKRTLLEKCQDEFDKQDIYVDWKKEKAEYEEKKSTMTDAEKAEREEELDFRRIRIKKQMLGNVKFIGQLYKKGLLKEKIMRLCIAQLLKLTEIESSSKSPEYKDDGDMDLDEEDHEAICSIFTTIGSTIDVQPAANFMNVCFKKIKAMSLDKSLPSRSRFMYKDLIDLRANSWVPRRKVENAKTLDEIRKEVEREERRQAQQTQQTRSGPHSGGGAASGRGGDFRQSRSGRGDNRSSLSASSRPRQARPETDDDGFTTIASSRTFTPKMTPTKILQNKGGASASASSLQRYAALDDDHATTPVVSSKEPLSKEQLARRIKSMRSDFIADGGNVSDLLLSMDEVLASNPDSGTEVVAKSVDSVIESKDDERAAALRVVAILFEKGRLTKANVEAGLGDAIEFIDSIKLDAPRAFEHLSLILGELLRVKAIGLRWICEQLEKTKVDPETKAPEEVLRHLLQAVKKSADRGAVESLISSSQGAPEKLVGADKWRSICSAI